MDDDQVPQLLDTSSPPQLEASLDVDQAGPSRADNFERPKVPITLLTGYLGAGKSTLLNYVLTAQHGYRIAVCMNDFGDTTDIEAKALTLSDPSSSSTTSSFLSLPNGCLCCSVKDLGIAAIEEMVASAPGGVDWVLVELTGVADPGPIIRSFWANEEMGDLILDGVVCVVDSRNILKQLAEQRPRGEINEAQKQVACADVILLNKLDLVSADQLARVESAIQSIYPTLRVHHTTNSRMPLDGMFNLRAFSDPAALTGASDLPSHPASRLQLQPNGTDHGGEDDHDHDHDHAGEGCDDPSHAGDAHLNGISTVLVPLPALTEGQYERLNAFFESVIWAGKYPRSSSRSTTVGQGETETITGAGEPETEDRRTSSSEDEDEDEDDEQVEPEWSVREGATKEPDVDVDGAGAPEILRSKGYIPLLNGSQYVLQGVADLFELTKLPSESGTERAGAGAGAVGKVVFIGKDVGEEMRVKLLDFVGLPI